MRNAKLKIQIGKNWAEERKGSIIKKKVERKMGVELKAKQVK